MSRIRRIAIVLAAAMLGAAAGCRSGPPAPVQAQRVVMVSYDGVGGDLGWSWIESGVATDPDGLGALATSGLAVRRLRMVTPTLTAVNHATLATGAWPSRTGIISNLFRPAGGAILDRVSGFDAPIEADTLWLAARRAGVPSASVLWPSVDGSTPARSADVGVAWPNHPLAAGEVVALDPAGSGRAADLPSADGVPALEWRVPVAVQGGASARVEVEVAAFDGAADGLARYDGVAMRLGGGDWQLTGELGWLPLELDAPDLDGEGPYHWRSWAKVLRLDRGSGAVRLYRGAFWRLLAWPEELADRLEAELGPWPGAPDDHELAAWWLDVLQGIDLDTYLEQAERLDRWIDAAIEIVLRTEPTRLMMGYHPTPDEYQHSSLIVDRDQWAWSPGKALAAAEGLKRIGRSVDRSVGDLTRLIDPTRDAFVMVSDHGHLPLHDEVFVNTVLARAGLVETQDTPDGPRVARSTPMVAVASGGVAELYLNLAGREPGGVVVPADADALLARAARALADLEQDGQPVVDRIYTREQAAREGFDHPNGGDLVVLLLPGWAASSALGPDAIAPSRYYAQHGYHARFDGMCGICLARGAGVARAERAEMPATAVAPLVAGLLGFQLEK